MIIASKNLGPCLQRRIGAQQAMGGGDQIAVSSALSYGRPDYPWRNDSSDDCFCETQTETEPSTRKDGSDGPQVESSFRTNLDKLRVLWCDEAVAHRPTEFGHFANWVKPCSRDTVHAEEIDFSAISHSMLHNRRIY